MLTTYSLFSRDCRRLADVLANILARDPEGLTFLRREFPRRYCAARLVSNLWNRDAVIVRNLYANLEDQARGRDVPDSISDWRNLNSAVESTLTQYWNALTVAHRQSLASLLINIVSHIFQTDRDLYANRNRTVYAGESSGGNLFRRFLSPRAEPIAFLGPLQRLDAQLLASRVDSLRDVINTFTGNGEAGSEGEQYRLVAQALMGIWSRKLTIRRSFDCYVTDLLQMLPANSSETNLVDVHLGAGSFSSCCVT